LDASPQSLVATLHDAGLRRAYLVCDESGKLRASHPALEPLASAVAASPDFRAHEACFFEIGAQSGHLLTAFIHDTRRGQGAGGLRFWHYETTGALIRDGLRLALGMGHKSALAGLWWGGGKGVIVRDPQRDHRDPALRELIFRDYGRFVSSLRGCYITAEDVGTTPDDLAWIHATTRFATCVSVAVGGSGNPSRLTALGVVVAMEAALDLLGQGSLEGKTVAMQGLGNVASFMVDRLLACGVSKIIGTDIDAERVASVQARHPAAPLALRVSTPGDTSIFAEACDILAPNAIGAVLDPETIPLLDTPVICGAANNQLARPSRDGDALRDRGIAYVPDFLANRMGIVNCANEQYGSFEDDDAIDAHLLRDTPHGIWQRTREVLGRSQKSGRSTHAEAVARAEELMAEPHPIWPHRGRSIVNSLVRSGWADRA
jgi:glutamate dehydrogenase/leucine dehydrogenase